MMVSFRHVTAAVAAYVIVAIGAGISSDPVRSIESFAVVAAPVATAVAASVVATSVVAVATAAVATAAVATDISPVATNITLVTSPVTSKEEETDSLGSDLLKPRGSEAFAVDFSPVPTAATDSTRSAYDFASSLLLDTSDLIAVALDQVISIRMVSSASFSWPEASALVVFARGQVGNSTSMDLFDASLFKDDPYLIADSDSTISFASGLWRDASRRLRESYDLASSLWRDSSDLIVFERGQLINTTSTDLFGSILWKEGPFAVTHEAQVSNVTDRFASSLLLSATASRRLQDAGSTLLAWFASTLLVCKHAASPSCCFLLRHHCVGAEVASPDAFPLARDHHGPFQLQAVPAD
jgi:hypothetical protein